MIKFVGGRSKAKIRARYICKRTLHIEFERDSFVGLGRTLGDGKHFKIFFQLQGYFQEKPIVSYCWVSNVLLLHEI